MLCELYFHINNPKFIPSKKENSKPKDKLPQKKFPLESINAPYLSSAFEAIKITNKTIC